MLKYFYQTSLGLSKPILHISDLHISLKINQKFLSDVLGFVNNYQGAYLIITGDIFDKGECVLDQKCRQILQDFLDNINKKIEIFIGLGNHDYLQNGYILLDEFKKFETDNIKVLINESYQNNELEIVSTLFDKEFYNNDLIEEIVDKFNNFEYKTSKTHILLNHSPINLTKEQVLQTDLIKNSDLVLCGHTHNGALPDIFVNNKNWGLILPNKKLLPQKIRGCISQNPLIIVNGGVSKVNPIHSKIIDKFYQPEINIIE